MLDVIWSEPCAEKFKSFHDSMLDMVQIPIPESSGSQDHVALVRGKPYRVYAGFVAHDSYKRPLERALLVIDSPISKKYLKLSFFCRTTWRIVGSLGGVHRTTVMSGERIGLGVRRPVFTFWLSYFLLVGF